MCHLEFKGTDHIQFKFITVKKDSTLVWEKGENKDLKLPVAGNFATVAAWDTTKKIWSCTLSMNLHSYFLNESRHPCADINIRLCFNGCQYPFTIIPSTNLSFITLSRQR